MGAGSISVLNKTGVKIIVTLSKFGYQYCKRIEPGDTEKIECRRMKFTVTARLWDGKEPTWWDWVKPVLVAIAVTAASVSLGAAFLFSEKVVEGAAAGATATYLANVLREVPGVITAVLAFGAEVNKSPETLQHENYKTWIGVTPSEQSATWLANNYVVAIDPAEKQNVYADGKTITIRVESANVGQRVMLDSTTLRVYHFSDETPHHADA